MQGSVVDPAMAESALVEGVAHLVGMTRAQIAEPDLARPSGPARWSARPPSAGSTAWIRTGVTADAASVCAEQSGAVVVATGARVGRPAWAGTLARVVDVRDGSSRGVSL